MARFVCRLAGGGTIGIQADSVPAALVEAQRRGESVIGIAEQPPRRTDPRVTEHELATLYRQLASMLAAGLPLSQGLQILARDSTNPALKEVCYTLYVTLAEGEPFAAGLAKFPGLFPRLHLALARAGEHAGLLPTTLAQTADYLERVGGLSRRVSSALVYPAVVATLVLALLSSYWGSGMVFQIAKIYQDVGLSNKLPRLTAVMLRFYQVSMPMFAFALVAAFVLVFIIRAYYRTRRGRYRLDRVKLWLPFIGQIVSKGALARFARTLALLLGNGVAVESALELAGEASGNNVVARAAKTAIGGVVEGSPLAPALAATGVFPAAVIEQIATGEKSGTLLVMLNNLSDFYDAQTEHLTRAFSAVLEPTLILILGFAVGITIVSLILPLVQAISALSGGG